MSQRKMSETVDINFFDQSDQVKPNVGVSLRDTTPPDWAYFDTSEDVENAEEAKDYTICDDPSPICNDQADATVAPDQSIVACNVACNTEKFVATCNNQKILPDCNTRKISPDCNTRKNFATCNNQDEFFHDATVADEDEKKSEWTTITNKRAKNEVQRSNLKLHMKYYGDIGNLREMLSLSGVTNPVIRKYKDSLVIRSNTILKARDWIKTKNFHCSMEFVRCFAWSG